MNDNTKKWVEALRSGDYKQTNGRLRADDGYCCLGVACEVYHQATGQGEWKNEPTGPSILGGSFFFATTERDLNGAWLPEPVMKWLGLRTEWGDFTRDDEDVSLVDLNDNCESFSTIADTIEAGPEGLFA